ncbi:MAG: tRNA uridine-5-carboxymethylaminomethyl(34) synthesis GTPase MnmE [Alphaproteobacteria bacterium]|nr:tRNA uridine-5-carboxymethylaminomethyl(34) synthesis GTPase MnmE [Alphaproteobacteria bacterium]
MSATIYAPATPSGIGAIAVVRVSGPGTRGALESLTRMPPPAPRRLSRRLLLDPTTGEAFDDALVVWFPAPHSFTGEDCAEFHLHGGRATLTIILGALGSLTEFRLARAGEFARRAFDNGKLDLTQVEGLADLVAADTAAQARQAFRQLSGKLGAQCEAWRQRLLLARAQVEAEIDFPDEDLDGALGDRLRPDLELLQCEMETAIRGSSRGERLRDGFTIAIVGPPNAGKSSLLNRLAGRDAAIVSAIAGTTRDILEVALDLGGWPVILADTAGLRAIDPAVNRDQALVEAEGMRRARAHADRADLRLVLLDASAPSVAIADPEARALLTRDAVLVWNKLDLAVDPEKLPGHPDGGRMIAISARNGTGCDSLALLLEQRAAAALSSGSVDGAALTRARHREAIADAQAALLRAIDTTDPELLAEELRHAGDAVGRITGRSDVEAMLDVLFNTFCIGK